MGRKYWDDGSTYDLKLGYRNAEKVKEDEENGVDTSLKMTVKEKENLMEGAYALMVIAFLVLLAFLGNTLVQQNSLKKEAVQLEQSDREHLAQAVHDSPSFYDAKVIKATRNSALISVPLYGERAVMKCDIEKVDFGTERHAYLFCDGADFAALKVKLENRK